MTDPRESETQARIEAATRTLYEWGRGEIGCEWERVPPVYKRQYRACAEAVLAAADAAASAVTVEAGAPKESNYAPT
jgi:hypothetical protein